MGVARYLTLIWPGMPWLWLRGSLMGLCLALAFAAALDVAVVATWIWPGLIDPRMTLAIWASTAVIWMASTASAVTGFPVPLATGGAAADALFAQARNAYLARDWLAAETAVCHLLRIAPTDGEAQLLLASLLRRVGRVDEARAALRSLSRSDSGLQWQAEIAREFARLDGGSERSDDDSPAILSLNSDATSRGAQDAAA